MKVFVSAVVAGLIGVSSVLGSNFNVDSSHSNLGFKVKHLMISNVNGKFTDFGGNFDYDPKTKIFSSLNGVVKIASITTENEKRDGHLKSADFFNEKEFPQMKVKLIKQTGDKALLAVTIKDVTKNINFDIEDSSGSIVDPWGNTRVGFTLNGKLNRQDFNMKFNQLLETGDLMVSDIVKINVEVEGIMSK